MSRPFVLWLEFEQHADGYPGPGDDPHCDFCNATLSVDGKKYGLNIWTFAFLDYARRFDDGGTRLAKPATFLVPPDLLVEKLDRALIQAAIESVLEEGLPSSWIPTQPVDET